MPDDNGFTDEGWRLRNEHIRFQQEQNSFRGTAGDQDWSWHFQYLDSDEEAMSIREEEEEQQHQQGTKRKLESSDTSELHDVYKEVRDEGGRLVGLIGRHHHLHFGQLLKTPQGKPMGAVTAVEGDMVRVSDGVWRAIPGSSWLFRDQVTETGSIPSYRARFAEEPSRTSTRGAGAGQDGVTGTEPVPSYLPAGRILPVPDGPSRGYGSLATCIHGTLKANVQLHQVRGSANFSQS